MGQLTLPGNPPINVMVRRSSRARRISLRVSGIDGRVSLTLPRSISEAEGLSFVQQKAGWLRKHLDRRPETIVIAPGSELPIEGELRQVLSGPGRRVTLDTETLWVPGAPERAGPRLRSWLKTMARERLAAASDDYAARLGRSYSGLTMRDTRSRWGSCSSQGRLNYSWRLIMAPPDVLDYVAAHEVAHLMEMNHSQAFWDTVARLKPGFNSPRAWLRRHGADLHRYRFEN